MAKIDADAVFEIRVAEMLRREGSDRWWTAGQVADELRDEDYRRVVRALDSLASRGVLNHHKQVARRPAIFKYKRKEKPNG